MEFLYIVVLLLVLSSLYLFYKTRNLKDKSDKYSNIENFETDIITAVESKYKHNIDALRNFAGITNNILTEDSFIMPASKIYMKESYITGDLEIEEDLIVNGNINFTLKNMNTFDIFPKYIILNWNTNIIPAGWALCNGLKYSLDSDGIAVVDDSQNGIQTPDLRGRIILGYGSGTGLTERLVGATGGEESHTLTTAEMPRHDHEYAGFIKGNIEDPGWFGSKYEVYWDNVNPGQEKTQYTGGNVPHENMPPFYVLNYIIKL